MASVIVYHHNSCKIETEGIMKEVDSNSSGGSIFVFFQLPHHIQIEIISNLSLKDTNKFATTSRESFSLSQDQLVWKKKLWKHIKAVNLSLDMRKCIQPPFATEILAKDPLLINMKKLYEILNPDGGNTGRREKLNMENLLSKIRTPPVISFSSVSLQDLLNYINTLFHRPTPIFNDPFSRGRNAPTFLLFGPPESYASKKLALSFIASKDSIFETVGLVKGKPGGIGGGVTVEFGQHLMNFLPVRRARPRLLVEKPFGTVFHPDVAQIASQVDGFIYYMDAKCCCCQCNIKSIAKKKSSSVNGLNPTAVLSNSFKNTWQLDPNSGIKNASEIHTLDNEFYELEAMLKSIPDIHPPILVILVQRNKTSTPHCSSSSESDEQEEKNTTDTPSKEKIYNHKPHDLFNRMGVVQNPWMITEVDVETLKGVHQGINWIYERTLLTKGK